MNLFFEKYRIQTTLSSTLCAVLFALLVVSGVVAKAQSPTAAVTNQQLLLDGPSTYAATSDRAGNIYLAGQYGVTMWPLNCNNISCAKLFTISGQFGPAGITVDDLGNVYVLDYFANKITQMPAGCFTSDCQVTVTTALSNPAGGIAYRISNSFTPDLNSNPAALFVADTGNNRVLQFGRYCMNGANSAPNWSCITTIGSNFNAPSAVAINPVISKVYVIDKVTNTSPQAYNLKIVSNNCDPQYCAPTITIPLGAVQPGRMNTDAAGNLYIAITSPPQILELPAGCTSSDCMVRIPASLTAPTDVTVDTAGNLLIADNGNKVVKRILNSLDAGSVSVGAVSTLSLEYTILKNQYISPNPRVLSQGQPNVDFFVAGSTCSGNINANTACTVTIRFAPRGPGTKKGVVQLLDFNQNPVHTLYVSGEGLGPAAAFVDVDPIQLELATNVVGATVDGSGNFYSFGYPNNQIVRYPAGCTISGCPQTVVTGVIGRALTMDPMGNFYSTTSGQLSRTPVGCTTAACTETFFGPFAIRGNDLTVDEAGNVYALSRGSEEFNYSNCTGTCVVMIPPGCKRNECTIPIVNNLKKVHKLETLISVAVDSSRTVYVLGLTGNSPPNPLIIKFPASGPAQVIAGSTGDLGFYPGSMTIDSVGNLFLLDLDLKRVIEIPAGCTSPGCYLYSKPYATTQNPLNSTEGSIAIDPANNLIVFDYTRGSAYLYPRGPGAALNFNPVPQGQSTSRQLTMRNVGNQTLVASPPGISIDEPRFTQTGCPANFSLAPGANCVSTLTFSSQEQGTYNGTISFTGNEAESVFTRAVKRVSLKALSLGPLVNISVGTSPANLVYFVDGLRYQSQSTFSWNQSTTHTLSVSSTITSGDTEYRFVNWSDGTTNPTKTFTVSASTPTRLFANFATFHKLTAQPGAGGTISPSTGYYQSEPAFQVTANPSPGFALASWSSNVLRDTQNPNTGLVDLSAPNTVTATFAPGVRVTLATAPAGLPIFVDGANFPANPSTVSWVIGSTHTISTPSPQFSLDELTKYVFKNWSDGGAISHSVTASTSVTSYTANFDTYFGVHATPNTQEGGQVSGSDYYLSGTRATLTATPSPGYAFTGWTGPVDSPSNPTTTILMNQVQVIKANFVRVIQVTVGTDPRIGPGYIVDGTAYLNAPVTLNWLEGSTHTIATNSTTFGPDTRLTFLNWSDGGAPTHTVTATAGVTSYLASFSTSYRLTIAANPSAGGTVSPASGTFYAAGSVVNLSATPNPGYTFTGWSTNVASPGSASTSITLNSPQTVTANFVQTSQVTVNTTPAGLPFTVDGTAYTTPQVFTWTVGSTHTIAASSPPPANGTQYTFNNWSDGGAASHTVTAVAGATTYTATYKTGYLLTLVANPPTAGTLTPASGAYYDSGTVVNLTATPNTGFIFSGWTGNVQDSANPSTTVTMNSPQTVTAKFDPTVRVTLGTSPAGLPFTVDGVTYTSTQTQTWVVGSSHNIGTQATQQPSPGTQHTFNNWSDGGDVTHAVTASTSTLNYLATFATSYLLTTSASPTAGGSVTPAPGAYYASGTVVNLGATPNSGYTFAGWTGSVAATNNASTTVTMNSPQTVSARFDPTVQVTVGTNPVGLSFTVDGTTYASAQTFTWIVGSNHTIATTATQSPSTGTQNTFTAWSDAGPISHTITASPDTRTYTATFSTAYLLTTSASPVAGGSATPDSGTFYPAGTTVNLNATPAPSYTFTNWTGAVASPDAATTTVTMTGPQTVTANFAPVVQVSVSSTQPGTSFTVDGASYTTTANFTWIVGSSHNIGTSATQNVSGGIQYAFAAWSDGGALSHEVIASAATSSYSVSFNTNYQLTLAATPSGAGVISPASGGYYRAGFVVNLTATANAGFSFANWAGSVANTSAASTTITMNAPASVTANFNPTVQVTVGTNLPGLAFSVDGVNYTAPQSFTWIVGSTHSVATVTSQTLTPGTRFDFASWSDGGAASHTLTASSVATSYLATFDTYYQLTAAASPTAGGAVSPATATFYRAGTTAPLTASPAPGYLFSSWTGPVANSSSASTGIVMTSPRSVSANFVSALRVTPGMDFGTVYLGTTTNRSATVTNLGTTPIAISSATLSALSGGSTKQFTVTNQCPASLAGGASCSVLVTFTAGAFFSAQTGTLTLASSAPGSPNTVSITALVIDPQASLGSTRVSFGGTAVNARSTNVVKLKNTGSTTLAITGMSISGANAASFAFTSDCGNSLTAGSSCSITFTFTPNTTGQLSSAFTLTSNAQVGSQTVQLNGNGR